MRIKLIHSGKWDSNPLPLIIIYYLKRPHTIRKMNDNINMNSAIEGSVNVRS